MFYSISSIGFILRLLPVFHLDLSVPSSGRTIKLQHSQSFDAFFVICYDTFFFIALFYTSRQDKNDFNK